MSLSLPRVINGEYSILFRACAALPFTHLFPCPLQEEIDVMVNEIDADGNGDIDFDGKFGNQITSTGRWCHARMAQALSLYDKLILIRLIVPCRVRGCDVAEGQHDLHL
jgi:hypothetical protein